MSKVEVRGVRCVAPVGARLGEGPLWDPRIGRLLFLDIKGERLFVYDPESEQCDTHEAPGMVSALGLRKAGDYVCAFVDGFAFLAVDKKGVKITPIVDPEADRPGNRFNDGKVDPFGGFWAGTMDDSQADDRGGSWWRLGADRKIARLDNGFHVTNGPAFDETRGRVYFTDSARRVIYEAETDGAAIDGKRVFLQFEERHGYPDGMTVDRAGRVWVAFWDGAAVRRFSPEGALEAEIAIPALRPTSVELVVDKAYVTSARLGLTAEQKESNPLSGGLFEIALSDAVAGPSRYFNG